MRPWGLEALRPWLMPRVIESNGLPERCPTSSNWICCLKTRDSWAQLDELDTWKTLRQIDWTRGKIAFFLRQTSSQIRRKWTIAMQVWGVAESWTPILAVILSWTQHQHISMFKAGFCTSRSKTAQTFQDEKLLKKCNSECKLMQETNTYLPSTIFWIILSCWRCSPRMPDHSRPPADPAHP